MNPHLESSVSLYFLYSFLFTQINSVLLYFTHPCDVFSRQILSATSTSQSSTWTWTVFSTCPTSPPSGTQRHCLNAAAAAERSRRTSPTAPCYDAAETLHLSADALAPTPVTHSLTSHLSSWITSASPVLHQEGSTRKN